MSEQNFVPKESTQQSKFLEKYPEYDGRGIKIAIFDADIVDKSLPGFQKTTADLPKIIYCSPKVGINVDTSKIVERNEKDYIIGLTGRRLNIPTKWKNPTDKWHLGSVPFKEIFDVTIEDDGQEFKKFDDEINKGENELASFKDKIIDCIVWFDGKKWCTCLDNSFLNPQQTWFSKLEDAKALTNFDNKKEFAYLIKNSIYCVTVAEDGNSLKIMYPHYDHGTLVAHVAAAYLPEKPKYSNGAAPGAQIISLHWGNIKEAFLKCIELKVDIVNVSCSFLLPPSIVEMIKKMVDEHGIIITQSAMNLGPFYSSISEQYWEISEQLFIIGSVFTDEMKAKFDYNESLNFPSIYHSSGKGPFLLSGARGVDFVAPGAAITDVPKWYLKKKRECCGTSFAAPNVAGSIACLLSALKANSIPYTPAMIKMALANTAFLPKGADKLAYGNGIIQICDAFEFIKNANHLPTKFLVPNLMEKPEQKGIIHIHNNDENNNDIFDYRINLDPTWERKWILKCTALNCCKNFVTHNENATNNFINIKIDTSALEKGSLNYAEIYGIDSVNPSMGPLFHLPITVICPTDASYFNEKIITVKPDPPTCFFIKKPATEIQKCCIKFTALDDEIKEETKIKFEFRQKKFIVSKYVVITVKHVLKFSAEKKIDTATFDFEKNEEEFYQICFYHNNLNAMKLKLELQLSE